MRYRIIRLWSGYEVEYLTGGQSEILQDGEIITYKSLNPIVAMLGASILKIEDGLSDVDIITALENEIVP